MGSALDAQQRARARPANPLRVLAGLSARALGDSAGLATIRTTPGGNLNAIRASWSGNERLWKVFWIYNWLFGTAIGIGSEAAANVLPWPALLVIGLLTVAWAIWITVSLWRCAFNASWRGWGYIVRAIVVVSVVAAIFGILVALFDEGVA